MCVRAALCLHVWRCVMPYVYALCLVPYAVVSMRVRMKCASPHTHRNKSITAGKIFEAGLGDGGMVL